MRALQGQVKIKPEDKHLLKKDHSSFLSRNIHQRYTMQLRLRPHHYKAAHTGHSSSAFREDSTHVPHPKDCQ